MKKYLLFDFDGVIADTFKIAHDLNREHHGLTTEQYKELFMGNIYDEVKKDRTDEEVQKHHDDWFEKYNPLLLRSVAFPGIEDSLKELSSDYTMAIISSTVTSPIHSFLEMHNLHHYFDIVFGSDVHFSKVEKIQMIFDKYGCGPRDCVFITDTVGDLLEAQKKEVPVFVVTWGFHEKERFVNQNFVSFINDAKEMKSLIDEHFQNLIN